MARDEAKAAQYKAEGNKHFGQGDYIGAESLYSKAIISDDTNAALFTNRAMARLRLELWDSAISDCLACLNISDQNMKANFILSQAQLQLRDFEAALTHAYTAHTICAKTNDKSLAAVTAQVLRCKKERWDKLEEKRIRESRRLERELVELLERDRDQALGSSDSAMEQDEIRSEYEERIGLLKTNFEIARPEPERKRSPPEWAIDEISFGIMVDPVTTKSGKSYERASIMEHLRRHEFDPLTREPLLPADLRPNLALKEACNDYLEKNGWAADW